MTNSFNPIRSWWIRDFSVSHNHSFFVVIYGDLIIIHSCNDIFNSVFFYYIHTLIYNWIGYISKSNTLSFQGCSGIQIIKTTLSLNNQSISFIPICEWSHLYFYLVKKILLQNLVLVTSNVMGISLLQNYIIT